MVFGNSLEHQSLYSIHLLRLIKGTPLRKEATETFTQEGRNPVPREAGRKHGHAVRERNIRHRAQPRGEPASTT